MIASDTNADIANTQDLLTYTYSSSDDVTDILLHIRQSNEDNTFRQNESISIDILPNIYITSTSDIAISMAPTKSVMELLKDMQNEQSLYRDVIKNMWRTYKYHQEYQSFLLGDYTEEEFVPVAEQYATTFQHITMERLTWASLLLLNILDNYLTSSDLSVLLNVDPFDLENALSSSSDFIVTLQENIEPHGE